MQFCMIFKVQKAIKMLTKKYNNGVNVRMRKRFSTAKICNWIFPVQAKDCMSYKFLFSIWKQI